MLKFDTVPQIVGKVIYWILLALGCYFIYEGDVLEKFTQKKTSFSENDEALTEYPNVMTYFLTTSFLTNLTMGKDFNITFKNFEPPVEHNLTFGKNKVGSFLLFNVEQIYLGGPIWIKPLNLIPSDCKRDRSFLLQWNLRADVLSTNPVTTTYLSTCLLYTSDAADE